MYVLLQLFDITLLQLNIYLIYYTNCNSYELLSFLQIIIITHVIIRNLIYTYYYNYFTIF